MGEQSTSPHPVTDYFPRTAWPRMFYSNIIFYSTKTLLNSVSSDTASRSMFRPADDKDNSMHMQISPWCHPVTFWACVWVTTRPGFIFSPRGEVSWELIWQNDKGHRAPPKNTPSVYSRWRSFSVPRSWCEPTGLAGGANPGSVRFRALSASRHVSQPDPGTRSCQQGSRCTVSMPSPAYEPIPFYSLLKKPKTSRSASWAADDLSGSTLTFLPISLKNSEGSKSNCLVF